jgi:hypothetical protein
VNIAFIPWNCRRTDHRIAETFKRPDRRFSVSVHGCDHTEAEFGVSDERWLRWQSRRALSRMDLHQELTGIKHNRIMVFPQGVFSKASLRALDHEGFLAAVNSTIWPADAASDEVAFRDLLDLAVVRFGGTPLFLRRYPDRLEEIALDLFLGRQVLLVEHHRFFKRGYEALSRCTSFVNRVAPGIMWTDLEELCTMACQIREVQGGSVHVRAFGPTLRLCNHRRERLSFHVSNLGALGELESVTWKGRAIEFAATATGVACTVSLNPEEEGVLAFERAQSKSAYADLVPTAKDRFKVFARRRLSEIRDNYLARSPVLFELARRGKSILPRL